MKRRLMIFAAFFGAILLFGAQNISADEPLEVERIRVRDPFILAEEGNYYLYAQTQNRGKNPIKGVEVYTSRDLKKWSAPATVLALPKELGVKMVWAPEVHRYRDAYYLFVTLSFYEAAATPKPVEGDWPEMNRRGTFVYRAEHPTGPFEPLGDGPLTPPDWMALDGTLWVEEGVPYLVFCHEWLQIIDGTIDRVRLSDDLSHAVEAPIPMLSARGVAGGVTGEKEGTVTDGPLLYRSAKAGALFMIWSTFLPQKGGYAVLLTKSESGKLAGPWSPSMPIFTHDGGHGMIFTALDGTLRLALHQPNRPGKERFQSFVLIDNGETLTVAEKPKPLSEQRARIAPKWLTDGLIYQINPRAFTPEGTLPATTAKLPELAELGVSIVYLCPVFVSDDDPRTEFWSPRQRKSGMNNPRNPYRMKDYDHVDPEYGTDDDLRAFIAEAHRLGLRVLLDMVYLHCGPGALLIEEHPNFVKRDKDGKVMNAAWAFPALDFENPELRAYLWKNMERWITEFDADGFRLDVADGIPLDFWETARRRLEAIRPDVVLLAEGTRLEDQLFAMDLNYGFPFFSALDGVLSGGKPASEVRKIKEQMAAGRPVGARIMHYFDNHDIANDDYENRREKKWGDAGNRAALFLCFTLDGVPMLYNGQEIADANRHSIFGPLPIDWSRSGSDAGKERRAFVRRLAEIRREHSALTNGGILWLDNSAPESILTFRRDTQGESVLAVVNLKNAPVSGNITGNFGGLEPIFENGSVSAADGAATFDLPPFGWWIGKFRP